MDGLAELPIDQVRRVGVVAIGRNEGHHLERCLDSVVGRERVVVYVDSGSTDNSVLAATARGVVVVQLDMSRPFTAARARNAGFERLMQIAPDVQFVQFTDGDCEVVEGWIDGAHRLMLGEARLGAVFGRRHERHRDASIYNLVCDLEWDTPLGGDSAFGGDAMVRVAALREVGGYDPQIIASEDRELWLRLRAAGWSTRRIDARMTLHDAQIHDFRKWWKRSERTGHAYGQLTSLCRGALHDPHHDRSQRRAVAWGLLLPAMVLGAAWPTAGWSLIGLLLYAIPVIRARRHGLARGWAGREALMFAVLCVVGRFPEAIGVVRWHWRRISGRVPTLIEYKGPALRDNEK